MAPYSSSGNRIPNSHREILALISLSLMDFLELADKKRVPPDQGQISAQQSACANCSKTRTRSSGDSVPACRRRLLDKTSRWVAEPVHATLSILSVVLFYFSSWCFLLQNQGTNNQNCLDRVIPASRLACTILSIVWKPHRLYDCRLKGRKDI